MKPCGHSPQWLYCPYKCLVMALRWCEARAWWLENTLMMLSLQSSTALSCTVLCKGYNEGFVNQCWKQGYVIRFSKLKRQMDLTHSGEGSVLTSFAGCKVFLWNLGWTLIKLISLRSHLKCKYSLKKKKRRKKELVCETTFIPWTGLRELDEEQPAVPWSLHINVSCESHNRLSAWVRVYHRSLSAVCCHNTITERKHHCAISHLAHIGPSLEQQ